eukprot:231242_1
MNQVVLLCTVLNLFFLRGSLVNACGKYEFYIWSDLPDTVQTAAAKLNYDEDSWNRIGTNAIEAVALSDLMDGIVIGRSKDGPIQFQFGDEEIEALKVLDLYDEKLPHPGMCWNYFVNHYMGYSWEDLSAPALNPFGNDLSEAVAVLGWNEEMWNSISDEGDVPESECKSWFALSPDEQWALQSMGWTGLKWMSYPLDPRCPTPDGSNEGSE